MDLCRFPALSGAAQVKDEDEEKGERYEREEEEDDNDDEDGNQRQLSTRPAAPTMQDLIE